MAMGFVKNNTWVLKEMDTPGMNYNKIDKYKNHQIL